jgi:hypothetical protein
MSLVTSKNGFDLPKNVQSGAEGINKHQENNTIVQHPIGTRDHDLDALPSHALFSKRTHRHDTDQRQQ